MWPQVLVALADPVAGFCLAGAALLANARSGGHFWFTWYMFLPHVGATLSDKFIVNTRNVSLYSYGTIFLNDLLFVNFTGVSSICCRYGGSMAGMCRAPSWSNGTMSTAAENR